MATLKIERAGGGHEQATYVRHLRTLTSGSGCYGKSRDLDLYRLADGTEVVCESPSNDARAIPVELFDVTAESALFLE